MSSRARDKRGGGGDKGGKVAEDASGKAQREEAAPEGVVFKPPMKPHRRVFILLCVILAVWVGVLLVMYFKTVYPQRHGGTGKGFSMKVEHVRADFR